MDRVELSIDGTRYLSSLLSPFFSFASLDTSCCCLSLILVIRIQFRIFLWNSPLPACVERPTPRKMTFFVHLTRRFAYANSGRTMARACKLLQAGTICARNRDVYYSVHILFSSDGLRALRDNKFATFVINI